jgi:glycosyltransferase involved in cell wall biosynthesis
MRVTMIAGTYAPAIGGVANHVSELSRSLAKMGHNVLCICGSDKNNVVKEAANLEVHRFSALNITSSTTKYSLSPDLHVHLRELITRHRPEIIHSHNAQFYNGMLADLAFACRGSSAVINTVHDHEGRSLVAPVLDYDWNMLLYVSDFVRRRLPATAPSVTLHLGIDLSLFRPVGHVNRKFAGLERPVVYHPARLLPWKGAEVGLEAFLQLRSQLGTGSLVLTASGDLGADGAAVSVVRERIEERAFEAGAWERVTFVDVPQENLASAMRAVDVVWYPTTGEEPFGLIPLEGMACGVPVIVTDSGGMVETVVDGVTGLVVPRGDPAALCRAAAYLLTEESARQRIVATALSYIRSHGISDYSSKLAEIYLICA